MSLTQVFNRAEQNELEQIFNQLQQSILETVIPENKLKVKLKDLHEKLPQDKLLQLYHSAVEQYYYFEIAQQFSEYIVQESTLTRKQGEIVIEKILSNYCNDFFRSHLIFLSFIDFEKKHLQIAANDKEKNIIQNQIFNIYHRVLKIPNSNLREFQSQYEKLQNNDQEKQKQLQIFNKTILQHDDLGAFERRFRQALIKNDKQQIQEQIDQISVMMTSKKIDVNKAINYFNIALFSDSSEIELIGELYWQFAQTNTNINDQKKILGRIIKQRQPTYLLFQKYLRILEIIQNDKQKNQIDQQQFQIDQNETEKTFLRFLPLLKTQEDKYNIQLNYVQYLSRSYISQFHNIESEQKQEFQQFIRNQYQKFQNQQQQNSFKGQAYINQAKVENLLFNNKDDALKYFEKGLQLFSKEAQNWKDYIICVNQQAFQSIQDRDKVRQIYKRAFENIKDDKITLLQDWLTFEQLFGDISELEKVEQKQSKLLLNSEGQLSQEEEQVSLEEQEGQEEEHDQENIDQEEDKEHQNKINKDKQEEFKLFVDSSKTIFVKNLPLDFTQDNVINLLGPKSGVLECRIVLNKKQESKGFAYIDFEDEESASKGAAQLNQKVIQGKVLVAQQSKPPKVYNNDEVTLYVSNLPFKLDEEKLKEEFLHLKEVRIIKNEKGESRGYGYLEFDDEKAMDIAFSKLKGNPYIQGRKVFVQFCKSLDKMKEQQSLNVIVMKNLPFKTRETDIKQLFDGMTITEIAIPKEKDGRPRGFAFVEFDNKKDFKTALSMDGIEYKSRKINILKSDRKLTHQQQDTQEVLNTNSDFKKLFNV